MITCVLQELDCYIYIILNFRNFLKFLNSLYLNIYIYMYIYDSEFSEFFIFKYIYIYIICNFKFSEIF